MNNFVPVINEKHGKKLAVLAFTDVDGTVNNQEVLEKDRLDTITPAKEAIEKLQNHGIPVGIVTARSFGETMVYQNALGTQGFTITEDGAVIILPTSIHKNLKILSQKRHVISHNQQTALILGAVELPKIKEFLKYISEQLKKQGLSENIISTCTTSPQTLKELIHYQTVDDAIRATDRLASAFVRDVTKKQYKLIIESAEAWNLRIIGTQHHAHILGKDADKGGAIQFIANNINLFLPNMKDVEGILPIVFGNDYNDLRLFEEAHTIGGIGVMVKDSNGHYRVPNEEIPSYVIKTKDSFGYGMKEAISTVFEQLGIV